MPFNVGPMELAIVLVIALLVFGPSKLPEIGGAVGKSIGEFRRATKDIQNDIVEPINEIRQPFTDLKNSVNLNSSAPATVVAAAPAAPAVTIKCPQCDFANADSGKFCGQCGAPLVPPEAPSQPAEEAAEV